MSQNKNLKRRKASEIFDWISSKSLALSTFLGKNQPAVFFATLVIFGIIYCSISLVNHYLIRTEALDLGVFNNVIWDYAHFQFNHGECLNTPPQNFLNDHLDLYLPIFSPLSYLFRSYTLLLVQIAAVLFGGVGIYKLGVYILKDKLTATFCMAFFLSFFGVYSALAFDYHSNVVAAMFVPWFLLQLFRANFKLAWVFLILIFIGKENMSLWMFFVCAGALLHFIRNKRYRLPLVLMMLASFAYFVVALEFVLPALSSKGEYNHFFYPVLGNSAGEAIKNLMARPFYYIQFLWEKNDLSGDPERAKNEFWQIIFWAGGLLTIIRPAAMLMCIPLIAQKMFSSRASLWGVGYQYNIEFAPILAFALILSLSLLKRQEHKRLFGFAMAALTFYMNTVVIYDARYGPHPENGRFFSIKHYQAKHDVQRIKAVLNSIPPKACVSASSRLLPHVAYRDNAYSMVHLEKADYFVHYNSLNTYPYSAENYKKKIDRALATGNWEVMIDDGEMFLMKKIELP